MRISRKVLASSGTLVVLVAGAWLGDAIVASHAEHSISRAVAQHANLEVDPSVYIGGMPYLQALITGEIPTLSVQSLDVDTPGFGLVNARAELTDVEVNRDQALSGDIVGATAKLMARQVSLDGVAVGAQLGITDLEISNPYDISPQGGPASEVKLTGTPGGFHKPVTVIATLRLNGSTFAMTPTKVVDAPEGQEGKAAEAFAWKLDTRSLPLSNQAEAVYVEGGSIYFEAQRRNATVRLGDLSPLETSQESEFDSTQYGKSSEGE